MFTDIVHGLQVRFTDSFPCDLGYQDPAHNPSLRYYYISLSTSYRKKKTKEKTHVKLVRESESATGRSNNRRVDDRTYVRGLLKVCRLSSMTVNFEK